MSKFITYLTIYSDIMAGSAIFGGCVGSAYGYKFNKDIVKCGTEGFYLGVVMGCTWPISVPLLLSGVLKVSVNEDPLRGTSINVTSNQ